MFGIAGLTVGMIGAFVAGIVVCAIVVFFVWRNNKKKFMQALLDIDEVVSKYDTPEEIEAAINEIFSKFKLSVKLKKLKNKKCC
jgi:hypothetical protein